MIDNLATNNFSYQYYSYNNFYNYYYYSTTNNTTVLLKNNANFWINWSESFIKS